jgi:hypothetical protein
MKKLFLTLMLAGAVAATPSTVSAAGVGGHAMGRAGVGAGHAMVRGAYGPRVAPYYRGYPGYGYGFAYDPFWYGPGFAYSGGYGYAYPYVVPTENAGALRLEVTPKTAQVFVDGYYAGVVDDFDGHFQHLEMTPGGHRIDVSQPGFQPLTFQTYVQPGHTTDYKAAMSPAAQ